MLPWWVHNEAKYHRFVRLDLAGGITMILENNEGFERYGLDWSKYAPWSPFSGIADPVDQDEAMKAAAVRYIVTRPLHWLRASADRIMVFFTPSDVAYSAFQQTMSAIILSLMLLGTLTTMMKGWEIAQFFVEAGVSGSVPLADRPEGQRLLSSQQPGDVIITAKLDRAFRSAADALGTLEQMKDDKIALHMIDLGGDVTGNGISKLVFTILSAVAENERDRIRERVRDVKRHRASQRLFNGGKRPFGFDVEGEGKNPPPRASRPR